VKKPIVIALGILGVLLVAFLGWLAYELATWDDPVKVIEVTSGSLRAYTIGETKEEILAKAVTESFHPDPTPTECPVIWIKVSEMTETQRKCLLNRDTWDIGAIGWGLCPERTDWHSQLQFKDGKLVKVMVRCTHAE
jgi:hypothetical protein